MKITNILHSVLNSLTQKNDAIFTYTKDKQEKYLNRLNNPENDIERSFNQYKCQMKLFNNIWLKVGMNLASLPMIIYFLVKHSDRVENKKVDGAVFFADGKPEKIIPLSLSKRYSTIVTVSDKGEQLDKIGRSFFYQIWRRHPFSWYFLLKILIKIRYYCFVINKFSPAAVICCNEYSFTSSSLTNLCEIYGVEHINVMHGEKLFYIRDSFFRFSKCYVWDQYYVNLFQKLRADENQFIIEVPESLLFNTGTTAEKTIDYTYYLGAEKGEVLRNIITSMNNLRENGKQVAIRPHPRYTNMTELLHEANNIIIEDGSKISIEESLLRTRNAISLYSSVLNQAEHNGVMVVIDDIADPVKYRLLMDLDYIMMKKNHKLLSEIIEVVNA